ncbi:MAG: hypothetical protein WDN08_00390 [Rhizomicrobium sp.]
MLTQQPYKLFSKGIILFLVGFGGFGGVLAGSVDPRPPGPDPILAGPAPGPCAAAAADSAYTPGVDATGNAVAPADPEAGTGMGAGKVFVTVPRRRGAEVGVPVDLAVLAPPACNPARSPR